MEVKLAQQEHLEFINSEISRADTAHYVNDDYSISTSFEIKTPDNILVVFEQGLPVGFFLCQPQNSILVDVHTNIRSCVNKLQAASMGMELLKDLGVLALTAHIPGYNHAAYRFSKKCGFTKLATLEKSFLSGGRRYDQHLMYKLL